jgi:hypothetical protein
MTSIRSVREPLQTRIPSIWTPSGWKRAICAFCLAIVTAGWAINEEPAIASMLSKISHAPTVVLALSTMAATPAAKAAQVSVLRASDPVIVAPPGSEINIEANFSAQGALPQDDSLVLFLVDARGAETTRA